MNKPRVKSVTHAELAPTEVQQSILRDVSAIMFVALLLFGINNFRQGNTLLGVIDLTVAGINVFNAWRLHAQYQVQYTGGWIVLLSGSVAVVIATITNSHGIFWSYVVSAGAFLIVGRKPALVFNCLFIPLIVTATQLSVDTAVSLRLGTTLTLVTVFAYIFATRIHNQNDRALAHADALKIANSAKSDFIANMSHEMRTPLTTVMGYSEELSQNTALDSATRNRLAIIVSNARSLSVLVDDVLDLSQNETGRLAVRNSTFELPEFVSELNLLWAEAAEIKGLHFELHIDSPLPRWVQTDRVRLTQIISNLLGNALKFTSEGEVALRFAYQADTGTLTVQVIDTGIGVPPGFEGQLFDQFSQADTSITRKWGGVGLGLHISRNVADALGARLEHVPQEPGSCFQLTLNLGSEPVELIEAHAVLEHVPVVSAATAAQFQGHILIVEDSVSIQLLVGLLAQQMGVTYRTCNNGLEALAALSGESFDLVLMDLQMPVMSGLDATRSIRDQGNTIPIIALSADVLLYEDEPDKLADFNGVLSKPISTERLRDAFGAHLSVVANVVTPGFD